MNSLKFALGKEQKREKGGTELDGSLLRGVNKSKSIGLLGLDVDNEEEQAHLQLKNDKLTLVLNDKMQAAYTKNASNFSETTFQRVIEQLLDETGLSSETQCHKAIMVRIDELKKDQDEQYKNFLTEFIVMLEIKLAKNKPKDKKAELNTYDEIVRCNFKKKEEKKIHLDVQHLRPAVRSRQKDIISSRSPRQNEHSNSNDKKLNHLFSTKEKGMKQSVKFEDEPHHISTQDESVSFSTVLATSMAIKQRRRKGEAIGRQSKSPKPEIANLMPKKDQGDDAFIFYRPKKGKN